MKSQQARLWERRFQSYVDQIMVQWELARTCHRRGDHDREILHSSKIREIMAKLKDMANNVPPGAKMPHLPTPKPLH